MKLKVGHLDYTVMTLPHAAMDAVGLRGTCDQNAQVITLDRGLPPQRMAETLLHEALHAVWRNAGLGEEALEEDAVSALGVGLSALLRDNPGFTALLGVLLDGLKAAPLYGPQGSP